MKQFGRQPDGPGELEEPFVNRERELRRLEELAAHVGQPRHQHAALIGLRRIGKSFVIREFVRRQREHGRLATILPCDAASGDPGAWARHMVRAVLIAVQPPLERILDLATRSQLTPYLTILPTELQTRAGALFEETEKARPSYDALFEGTLRLPQRLAEAAGRKVIFCLDEFPAVLRLRKWRGLGSLDGIARDVLEERSPDLLFVLAGSAVRQMRDILEGPAPLLTRVQPITVGTFDDAAAGILVDALLPYHECSLDASAREDLLQYAANHPYWISRLVQRACDIARTGGAGHIARSHVTEAIYYEVVDKDGAIAAVCTWIYDNSLTKTAENDRLLLRTLSRFESPVRPSDLAATDALKAWNRVKLHRHLDALVRAGVLTEVGERENALVGLADPVLATWMARKSGYVGPTQEDLVASLRKVIERQAYEKSRWYESYIKVAMDEFKGARWPGETFGPAAPARLGLPNFDGVELNPRVNGTHGEDVELDAYGHGSEAWLVEAKAELTKAAKKDLQTFEEKAREFRHNGYRVDRLWFVALAGFTPEATAHAKERDIFITTGHQLATLWLELQKRKKRRAARTP